LVKLTTLPQFVQEIVMFRKLMKKILFLGVIFVVLSGCKSPVPEDIIQPDQMGKILYDIHMVDSYISTMSNQDSAKRVAASYYKGIYQKFKIDSVSYQKSMDFYYSNPEIMAELYNNIQAKIKDTKTKAEKRQEALLKLETKNRLRRDSLRNDSIKKADLVKKKALKKTSVKDSVAKKRADSIKARKRLPRQRMQQSAKEIKNVNNKPTLK
jgi:hypothetical protein